MREFFNLQRFAVLKGTEGHDNIITEVENTAVYGYGGNDTLYNGYNDVTLSGGEGNDSIKSGDHWWGAARYDRPLTNNIYIMAGSGNDYVSINGGASTIKGDAGNDIIDSYHNNNYLNGGEGHDSIRSEGQNATLIGGNGHDTLRNYGDNSTVLGGEGKDSVENKGGYTFINGGESKDEISSYTGQAVTITGGAGNDVIWSRDNSSGSVVGGSGDDSIYVYNHTANITLAGGTGNDMVSLTGDVTAEIQYTAGDGNDTIYGFDENDILYIAGSKFSTMASDDNSLIVKVGKNIITLNNAADKSLDIEKVSSFPGDGDYSGNLNPTELTAGKNFTGTNIDLTDHPTVEKLNTSAVSQNLTIVGNKLDNSIKGGAGKDTISGGIGADTLLGGKGNDNLTGGAGKDVFVYANGDGKDVITDYTAKQDKIQITSGTISKTGINGRNVVFTIGSGTLTVKNGRGKKITVIDSSGEETTQVYKHSSSNSALFAEDNFVTSDNLDSIVENNLSAVDYKIETQNFENLTQENLITFAEK